MCVAAPPQHGKTETTIHALVWWLKKFPHLRFAYATYSQTRADSVSVKAARIADRAGLELSTCKLREWITPQGGGVIWTSVGGALTGSPIDGVLVIDDAFKDRQEAQSPVYRQRFKDWFVDVAESRVHPGASIINMMTRWHPDDASGYLTKTQGFRYVNLKAIADDDRPDGDERKPGEALWEAHRPLAMLQERQQRNPWNFAALYQGLPTPRGASLFGEPARYQTSALPQYGYRVGYGVDLAYTAKTAADWSVLVELWLGEDGRCYVIRVVRRQVAAPEFCQLMANAAAGRSGGFYWYAAGTEKGSAQFIQQSGLPLHVMDPQGRDKHSRAQAAAEAWNAGEVLVPDTDEESIADFVDEVTGFTGVNDPNDDQVDAFVAVFDALKALGVGGGKAITAGSSYR